MGKSKSPPDAYPPCFYHPESCPVPCISEEYADCPVNPKVREKRQVEAVMGADTPFNPEKYRIKKELIKRKYELLKNPHAMEITENLRKLHSVDSGVVCPSCGETDSHGNTMNGKKYCFKCQLPMVSKEKAEKWIKPTPQKRASRGYIEPEGIFRKRS